MVLPGGLWQVCLLAFSFLKAEANSVSYDASCMFVFIRLVKLFIAFVSQQTIPLACLPPFIPSTPSPSPSENITINYCLFCSDRNLCFLWESRMNVFVPMTHRHNIDSVRTCVFSRFESCPTLWPLNCSPPGSSVHGILQARILEWVAMPSSRGSSWLRDQTHISCTAGGFFTAEQPRKPNSDNTSLYYFRNILNTLESNWSQWDVIPQ